MIQVQVLGIRLEVPSNQPVLLLGDLERPRYLPLWIGTAEATSISLAIDEIHTSRPLTHDLLVTVMQEFDAQLSSVCITELDEGTFYAVLQFENHDSISVRPSDAVAVAVRTGVPIYVSQEVMDEAGMDFNEEELGASGEEEIAPLTQQDIEQFKKFLEDINPEDFS